MERNDALKVYYAFLKATTEYELKHIEVFKKKNEIYVYSYERNKTTFQKHFSSPELAQPAIFLNLTSYVAIDESGYMYLKIF